jgi:hypothetical protein
MAKNTIVDTVADAVVRAELAIVRTGRQAVQAVNRRIGAGKRKVAGKKKAAKKAVRKAASRTKRTVKRSVRKVARKVASKTAKAAKRVRRR